MINYYLGQYIPMFTNPKAVPMTGGPTPAVLSKANSKMGQGDIDYRRFMFQLDLKTFQGQILTTREGSGDLARAQLFHFGQLDTASAPTRTS